MKTLSQLYKELAQGCKEKNDSFGYHYWNMRLKEITCYQ